MSEGGDSRWGTGFLLGFLLGVFVCLGAGGTFIAVQQQRMQEQLQHARMLEEKARAEAEVAARAVEVSSLASTKASQEALRRAEAVLRESASAQAGEEGRAPAAAELLPMPREKPAGGK